MALNSYCHIYVVFLSSFNLAYSKISSKIYQIQSCLFFLPPPPPQKKSHILQGAAMSRNFVHVANLIYYIRQWFFGILDRGHPLPVSGDQWPNLGTSAHKAGIL